VFERFTERARQVVVLAQDEARELRHNYIGTEHLLLGLIREEQGLAARVLAALGVTLDDARGRVRAVVGEGEEATTGQIPFTPRAKRTLELALREAHALGHDYLGTEHILLGLARVGEGIALQILFDMGIEADALRSEVIRQFEGGSTVTSRGSYWPVVPRPWPPQEDVAERRRARPVELLVAGWLLFGLALGVGILIGWAIWGN